MTLPRLPKYLPLLALLALSTLTSLPAQDVSPGSNNATPLTTAAPPPPATPTPVASPTTSVAATPGVSPEAPQPVSMQSLILKIKQWISDIAHSIEVQLTPAPAATPTPAPSATPAATPIATPTPEATPTPTPISWKGLTGPLIKVCQKEILMNGKKIGFAQIPIGTKVTVVSELPDELMVIREAGEEPFKISKDSLVAKQVTPESNRATKLTTAETNPATLPQGVPSLDAMAGDWIPMTNVANPPAVHNFNQMLVVDRDLTSFFCNPGGLYPWKHGYPIVTLSINGKEYPATETRCYAYQALRRNQDCNGLSVETDTRMVNEQRGVLCQITATNTTSQTIHTAMTLQVPGKLQPDGLGVMNDTQITNIVSFIRPSVKPDSVTTTTNGLCWNWTLEVPAGGTVKLGFVAGDEAKEKAPQTEARVADWAAHFSSLFDECKSIWEQRWADAFTPENNHFSGHLPALATTNAALARNYYMGVQTMLALERTQFSVSSQSFITSGERADGVQYYWDASMQATVWALLEPVGMKAPLRRWLVQNPRSGSTVNIQYSGNKYDEKHHDRITGYAFNASTIFKTADEYLRVTRDLAFLDEKLDDKKTVLDHLDALAMDWETLPKGPHGLGNYGENKNLLECA